MSFHIYLPSLYTYLWYTLRIPLHLVVDRAFGNPLLVTLSLVLRLIGILFLEGFIWILSVILVALKFSLGVFVFF